MPRLILLGPPGSGKGTQAARIKQNYNIPAISTGDALREQLASGSNIGLRAKSYMDMGKLVPDDIIIGLVEDLYEKNDITNGFLLDGFPRTIAQAEALDAFLAKKDKRIEKVIFLKVPKEVLLKRLANRRICPACGMSYNMSGRTPETEDYCDICRTNLVQREDDEPKTVEKRIVVYNEQTSPLIEYYNKQGLLIEVDGTKDIDMLQKQIDTAIKGA